jgi:hypothetical protein
MLELNDFCVFCWPTRLARRSVKGSDTRGVLISDRSHDDSSGRSICSAWAVVAPHAVVIMMLWGSYDRDQRLVKVADPCGNVWKWAKYGPHDCTKKVGTPRPRAS